MPKIQKHLKGRRRDFIDFYGNHIAGPFSELIEALGNRGYEVEIRNEYDGVTENLPGELRLDKPYTIIETVVFTINPDLKDSLHPLSSLSRTHYWRSYFHNSKTSVPEERVRIKRKR